MYNKIYQILDEKGRAKTGIFLDGPYMGKKCILKPETVIREENCGEAAEKKSSVQLIPEKTEDASIWDNYLNILSETKETKVTEADGHRLFVEDYRKNPRLVIFGGGHVSQPTAHLGKMLGFHVTIMDDREDFVKKARFPEADQLVCFRESSLFHEIFSVIHDRHMKAKHFSQMGSRLGYVTASKDHKPWILAVIFYEKPVTVCFCHFCLFRLTQNIQIIIPYGSIFCFLGDQLYT